MEKLCLFCKNLDQEFQSMGSEWTGAYGENGFTCKKRYFSEYECSSLESMRVLFLKAETCKDYEPATGE